MEGEDRLAELESQSKHTKTFSYTPNLLDLFNTKVEKFHLSDPLWKSVTRLKFGVKSNLPAAGQEGALSVIGVIDDFVGKGIKDKSSL